RVPVHAGDLVLGRPGNLVVADDVLPVQRDVETPGEVPHQAGRGPVEDLGVPGGSLDGETLVLDADRVGVNVPVAGVPGDVARRDHLGHVAVRRADHVVGG